jgi:hypothetical protein
MPKKPPNFDCRSVGQVLRLRLRDWMWPSALALVIAIPFAGRSSGPYPIGSLTYYANTLGPPLMLAAMIFAGIRWCTLGWCWIGATPQRDPTRCAHCDYLLAGLDAHQGPQRCPECGTDTTTPPTWRRPSIARMLIDLPGVLLASFPIFLIAILMLALFGLIDLDL